MNPTVKMIGSWLVHGAIAFAMNGALYLLLGSPGVVFAGGMYYLGKEMEAYRILTQREPYTALDWLDGIMDAAVPIAVSIRLFGTTNPFVVKDADRCISFCTNTS